MRVGMVAAMAAVLVAAAPAKKLTPNEIVEASKAGEWREIPAEDLMVIQLRPGKTVVVQLAPEFAPVHVANIRSMTRSGHWAKATIYRVQDNYVAQWGNNDDNAPPAKGIVAKPPAEYMRSLKGLAIKPLGFPDAYAPAAGFARGWPVAYSPRGGWASLAHCYGSVGVARGLEDVGDGSELYAIIGHAPRQLDRNIAVVGRVIDGIDRLSTLPRGGEGMGFYNSKSQYVAIGSIRMASDLPPAERPRFEALDTGSTSFAKYLRVRAHRDDDFYRTPALGVDVCNVQVPVRRKA